jgi:hypothetical protein
MTLATFIITMLLTTGSGQIGEKQSEQTPLQVSGARVVFFGPTRPERDSIAAMDGLEVDDVLDDFNYYTGKVAVYLSGQKIPFEFTTSTIILVRVDKSKFRTFDRKEVPELVGMILTDGIQEPRLVRGAGTERDLIAEIVEFFHLR